MCWLQLATALLLALAAGAAAEMASAPAPAMAANLRPGAPALAGGPRACLRVVLSCPHRPGHVASNLRSIHNRLQHGDMGVARGRAVSATPMDRKVLQRVPELPRVQAWFDQKSGFFTMRDNPQNATCRVRMRSRTPSVRHSMHPAGWCKDSQRYPRPTPITDPLDNPALAMATASRTWSCHATHVRPPTSSKCCSGRRCKCGLRSPGIQTPRGTLTPTPQPRPSRPPSTARSP